MTCGCAFPAICYHAKPRPAPSCREAGQCTGPNAYCAICDCYDAIWEGENWWESTPASPLVAVRSPVEQHLERGALDE
jgi:hypothetical protein